MCPFLFIHSFYFLSFFISFRDGNGRFHPRLSIRLPVNREQIDKQKSSAHFPLNFNFFNPPPTYRHVMLYRVMMSIPPSIPLLFSVRTYVVAPKCKCTHTHDVGSLLAKVLGTIYLTSFLYPLHTLNRSKQKSSFYGSKYYAFYCRVANYLVHLSKYAWRKSVSEYLDAIAMV